MRTNNVNMQIGDTDVAAGNPVPINDAGGSITVDGSLTVEESVIDASTDDVHAPAANTAAIASYPATPNVYHIISGVAWSYDGDPTGGRLSIVMNGSTVFDVNITKGGPGVFSFVPPKRFGVGDAVSVTLAAGGAGVTGKVSVLGHWTE